MKKMNKVTILTTLICLIPVIVGLVLYPRLPEQMATHWGFDGEPNGYSSRLMAAVVLPGILLLVNLFFPVLLKVDPKYKNMNDKLVVLAHWIIPVVSLLCSTATLSAAFGRNMRMELIMPFLLGVLFVFIGNYLPKTKQSYTMGIKLPWTLNSEANWNATHRLAGFVWVIGGLAMIVGGLFPFRYVIFFAAAIAMLAIPTVYSYLYYRKESAGK